MDRSVDERYLVNEDVVKILNRVVSRYDTQAQAAEALNVSLSHMSAVLHGKVMPGYRLLHALQLKKIVHYVREE